MRHVAAGMAVAALALAGMAQPAAAAPEETFSSDNFTITWVDNPSSPNAPDLTDADANGVPDGIERLLAAFEAARAFELGDLGFKAPPIQGKYPLYVAVGDGTGYTRTSPGGTGRSRPSFIVIPPDIADPGNSDGYMRAFAAHEYFHAIQYGYDAGENGWALEASATLMEDLLADESDLNHVYLRRFVPFPRVGLDGGGEGDYGAFLFLQFLAERYGGGSVAGVDIVRELWEAMAVPDAIAGAPDLNSLSALPVVLAARGIALEQAWSEFLVWRRYLGSFEEGAAYEKALAGTRWRSVLRSTRVETESCRLTTDTREGSGLPALSGDYVRLLPGRNGPRRIKGELIVEGPPGTSGFVAKRSKTGNRQITFLTFDELGLARIGVPFGRRQLSHITLGLGNGSIAPDPVTVGYALILAGSKEVVASAPAAPPTTTYGLAVRVSGRVECRGEPAPFADVVVTETAVVSGQQQTFGTETNEFGTWSLGVEPQVNSTYSVKVVDPLLSAAMSDETAIGVRLLITLELDADRVAQGSPVTLSGEVVPAHPGILVVVECRRPAREWERCGETSADSSGAYAADVLLPKSGIWEVRARVESTGDDDHVPAASIAELVEVVATTP
jgi:hypothetical protein